MLAWENSNVWDTDFIDPNVSGIPYANDTNNFDKRGNALAYVCAHGEVQDSTCTTSQSCSSTSQCLSASAWNSLGVEPYSLWGEPHSCVREPFNLGSRCCYFGPRAIIPWSPSSRYGNYVDYSLNPSVKWGEGTYGPWAGAGVNGGSKLVVMSISHGAIPGVTAAHLSNMFAGMWAVATIMPVTGDTNQVATRGSSYALYYWANPSSSPGASWISSMNSLPNGGINGYGCHVFYSMDSSTYWTNHHVNTARWIDYTNDNFDADGNSAWSLLWGCNYDAATYPPSN